MKNLTSLLFVFLPLLAFSQKNAAIEVSAGMNFTDYSNKIIGSKGRLNYDFGMAMAFPTKNTSREWLLGLRLIAYGDKYDSGSLKWGTQHNGSGGFDPNLPSGEPTTSFNQKSSYFYLELPATFRQVLTKGKNRLFAQASAGPAYFLSGWNQNSYELTVGGTQSGISPDNTSDFRTLNLFAGIGLGWECPIGKKISLQLLAHGQSQILSIVGETETNPKWYAYGLRGGLRYRLY